MDKEGKKLKEAHQSALTKIGLNIMFYRKQKGYSQQQLAEIISYSKNHVQQIETAKAAPSIFILLDIAEALDIPVVKLFEDR